MEGNFLMCAASTNHKNSESTFYTPKEAILQPEFRREAAELVRLIQRTYDKNIGDSEVFLSQSIAFEAVNSCLHDIKRLKAFRSIEQEDRHKRAAFLTKWITKVRPVQFFRDAATNLPPATLLVNERLAVALALDLLKVKTSFLLHDSMKAYLKNFLYLLHFHSCSAEYMASEFFMLEQVATQMALKQS